MSALPNAKDLPKRPESDEIEISVFGRGVGECIVIHLGNNEWMIIDSHLDQETNEPIAIKYLKQIGVNPAKDVVAILISHWHKDHIAGIYQVVESCSKAALFFPGVFNKKEFLTFLVAQTKIATEIDASYGAKEMLKILDSDREYTLVFCDTLLHRRQGILPVNVFAISPSNYELKEFLKYIGSKLPKVNLRPLKVSDRHPNLVSTVVHIDIGETTILLGADMENHKNPQKGWSAVITGSKVIKSHPRKSSLFKVAHHGANSGYSEDVWKNLLEPNVMALIAPYTAQSNPIPTRSDILRMERATKNAYITCAPFKKQKVEGRHPSAQKHANKTPRRSLESIYTSMGQICARMKIPLKSNNPKDWYIEKYGKAMSMAEVKNTLQWTEDSLSSGKK